MRPRAGRATMVGPDSGRGIDETSHMLVPTGPPPAILGLAFVVFVFATVSSPLRAQSLQEAPSTIRWGDRLLYLSEELLNDTVATSLRERLGHHEAWPMRLGNALSNAGAPLIQQSGELPCAAPARIRYPIDHVGQDEAVPLDLSRRIYSLSDSAGSGEIVSIRAGWSVLDDVPAQLLEVKLGALYANIRRRPEPGESVWLVYPVGTVRIGANRWCTSYGPRPSIAVGDSILFSGFQISDQPRIIAILELFLVEDGLVVPAPYAGVVVSPGLTLGALRTPGQRRE